MPLLLYMLCDIIYKILNILSLIYFLSVAQVWISLPKAIAELFYVIYTCSIEDLNHHMRFKPSSKIFYWPFQGGTSFVDLLCFFVLCLLCLCARLFICALWSPARKGLTSWLSFVVSNCEFVTFGLVSWVGCGTWLYRLLIFAPLLTLVLALHGQMHHLIPHADAVELAFIFIYIYKQQMLWCV